MKLLWILFVGLMLFVLYAQRCIQGKHDFQVIQLELSQITDETLREKYPIYIEDRVVSLNDVVSSMFKYSYIKRKNTKITGDVPHLSFSKYAIIHNTFDTEITVMLKNKSETVEFIIEPDRILVVPYRWEFTLDRTIVVVELWDIIHWVFQKW